MNQAHAIFEQGVMRLGVLSVSSAKISGLYCKSEIRSGKAENASTKKSTTLLSLAEKQKCRG